MYVLPTPLSTSHFSPTIPKAHDYHNHNFDAFSVVVVLVLVSVVILRSIIIVGTIVV